jgi:hypothetical protein
MRMPVVIVALITWALAAPHSSGSAQSSQPGLTAASAEAIHEHLDEAEDVVESLLQWRHVLTAFNTDRDDPKKPMAPRNTLITVDRGQVQRLAQLVDAVAAMTPPGGAGVTPRGDVGAHAHKAREIARELVPGATTGPVGTSGTAGLITIDRTAVQRLEVELDAIEELLPRQAP